MAHCHLLYAFNECSWLAALELPSFACLQYHHHHHHELRHQHVQCSLHAIFYLPLLKASSTATHTQIPKRQRENRNGFPSPLDALWPPLADAATNRMTAATATSATLPHCTRVNPQAELSRPGSELSKWLLIAENSLLLLLRLLLRCVVGNRRATGAIKCN